MTRLRGHSKEKGFTPEDDQGEGRANMTEAQIKHMVERFLSWKLPEDFAPDGGITFKPMFNEHTAHPMRHEPFGTNLLNYHQAEAMVRHILDGMREA